MSQRAMMRHSVFVEPKVYPIWCWNAHTRRARSREKLRARAEAFINEIGADTVVSVAEHAPLLGAFTVVVWYREMTDDGGLVARAVEAEHTA